jgi:hypothetical protein
VTTKEKRIGDQTSTMLVSDKGQVYRHALASLIASSWLGFSSDLGRVSDLEHVFGLRYAYQSPHHPLIDQSPHRSLDDEIVDTLSKETSRTREQSIRLAGINKGEDLNIGMKFFSIPLQS